MSKLTFKPIESSQINGYNYNGGLGTLTIQFKNGAYYEYFGVPGDVIEEFETSESKGKFFHTHIKDVFEFKKLNYEP